MAAGTPSLRLRNGDALPQIGLGTYRLTSVEATSVVETAVKIGYRLIDTAQVYRNESGVGGALRQLLDDPCSGITRESLFVTTKLGPSEHGAAARQALERSLEALQLDFVDLYLIHWPGSSKTPPGSERNRKNRELSWKVLEELKAEGKARHIGVSNYTEQHLREMLGYAIEMPAVNQIEVHPRWVPERDIEFCREHGILVQAYSSLGAGHLLASGDAKIDAVERVAKARGVSTPQVLLRWGIESGFGVIPKASSMERLQENLSVTHLNLTRGELEAIDVDVASQPRRKFCWDPKSVA